MTRENLLKLRRGTSIQWAQANPVLEAGEPGFESDTKTFKIGDGSTSWNSLKYVGFDGGNLDDDTPAASATPTPTPVPPTATPTPTASATPIPVVTH